MSWSIVELGDLAEFRNGINYNQNNFGTGIKVIGVVNFQNYIKPRYHELEEVNPEGVVKDEDILQNNDILFVRSNGNKNLIGRSLFIESPPEPVTFSGFCIRTRFTSNQVFPRFFAYLFRSDLIRQTLSAYGGGTNIANLNQKILSRLQVPLPPLPTQQRIAEILSTYDRLIDNNNRRIALLEESIHQLYKEWFVRSRFPGYESVKVVDGIPEGWNRKTLKDIALSIRQSIHPSKTELNTPYVGLEHIPRQSIALSSWGYSNQVDSNKFVFTKSDILFGKIRPYFHKVVFAPINGICSSDAIVIRPINQDLFGLTLSIVSSVAFVDYTSKTSKEGSKMPRANWDVMEQYPILIPSPKLLQEFNTLVSLATHQIRNLIFTNQHLNQARDLLLPRLMSGSIAV